MSKYKYHRTKDPDTRGRCVGEHCIHCWMLGRTHSLYGDKIKPVPKEHKE